MLRSMRIRTLPDACGLSGPAGVIMLLALLAGGCSADLARFDFPSAGYAPDGSRGSSTNSIPIPSEPVRRNAGIPPDTGPSYESGPIDGYDGRGRNAPPMAGQGDAYQPRSYEGSGRGDYGGSQSSYRGPAPSYNGQQLGYEAPPSGYGGAPRGYEASQPSTAGEGPRTYGGRTRDGERIASLPPAQQDFGGQSAGMPASREQSGASHAAPQSTTRWAAPAPKPVPVTTIAGGDTIEVQPGDTLSSLARRYKMSVSELMKLNNLENPRVWPGQKIVVPAGKRAVAQRERTAPVASQAGASTIASGGHVAERTAPVASQANAGTAASGGHVPPLGGQSQVASAPAQSVSAQGAGASPSDWHGSYTIGQGESLYGIARKHGVKVAELQRVNGITDVTKIRPGTVLKVPGGGTQQRIASSTARPAGEQSSAPITPQGATSQLTVRPRIINGETPPANEPQRVAALEANGRTANDATPGAVAARSEPAGGLPETPKLAGTGKFRWPVKGKIIAGFGFKPDKTHNDGINISVPQGTDVLAAESGVVAYAGNELKGYGNLILIRHEGGWVTAYAHGDELLVKRGDKVRRGQPIAKAGSTGAVDQPQVHFELRQESKPVDPIPHMEK